MPVTQIDKVFAMGEEGRRERKRRGCSSEQRDFHTHFFAKLTINVLL